MNLPSIRLLAIFLLLASCNLDVIDPVEPVYTFETRIAGLNGAAASGYDIWQTADTGYIVFGWTQTPSGTADFYQLKFDKKGVQESAKAFGSGGYDYVATSFVQGPGAYIIGGESDGKFYVGRTDANGNQTWTYTGETGYCTSVVPTNDGNLLAIGNQYGGVNTLSDIVLVKLSLTGTTIWTRKISTNVAEYGNQVVAESGTSFMIGGWQTANGNSDAMLIRVDANGNEVLRKTYSASGTNFDYANGMSKTSDGGFILIGRTEPDGINSNIYVQKVDNALNAEWQKTFGDSGYDNGKRVIELQEGGFAVMGEVSFASFPVTWLAKLSASGQEVWVKTYDTGSADEYPLGLRQARDKGFVITGATYEPSGGNILLIKTDPDGNL